MSRPSLAVLGGSAAVAAGAYATFLSPTAQLVGPIPYRLPTSEKVVALTFDDGPNEPYTSRLADLLAEREVSATFFQVGRCIERFPETTRRLVADGHLVGNHSWSHQLHRCLGENTIRAETERTSQLLTDITGRPPVSYRPPWLLRTPAHFRVLSDLGLQPVSGTFCHPLEICQPPARQIARLTVRAVRPGSIMIFHDGYNAQTADRTQTVAAVGLVIDRLRHQGYRFVTVDPTVLAARRS
ncbi:MAG: polysaccharide deacetylase family protein [Propionibacteriaceae bacterium]